MLKPSTKFDRWAQANAGRIDQEGKELRLLVDLISLELKSIERARKGYPAILFDAAVERQTKLKDELEACGIDLPDVQIPKIKIIRPKQRGAR